MKEHVGDIKTEKVHKQDWDGMYVVLCTYMKIYHYLSLQFTIISWSLYHSHLMFCIQTVDFHIRG